MADRTKKQTPKAAEKFDAEPKPQDAIPHDRRRGLDRRHREPEVRAAESTDPGHVPNERRAKKERRRRVDPTTFEKQYSDDEIEFMNAMQYFKMQSGSSFPTYGEVLKVAQKLGYRKTIEQLTQSSDGSPLFPEGRNDS